MFGKSGLWSFAVGQVDVLPGGGAGRSIAPAGTTDQGIEPETSDVRVPDRDGVAARRKGGGSIASVCNGSGGGKSCKVVKKMRKTKRKVAVRGERVRAQKPNQVWSYDFVHDRLENGAGLKMLTVLDECTRECLGILVERSITAAGVIGFLEVLMLKRGQPEHVRSDNGPEFVADALKGWLERAGIKSEYIEPGSPMGERARGKLPWEVARGLFKSGSIWEFAGSQSAGGRMAPAI